MVAVWLAVQAIVFVVLKPWTASTTNSDSIPGPSLAKFTCFWKIFHVLRGTYHQALLRLHHHHSIVRVGPREYSYKDSSGLVTKFIMSRRVYEHEAAIDECNELLLKSLLNYTDTPIQLNKLISCYAWDVMGAISVGHVFGFMEGDKKDLVNHINDWNLTSVLNGSFFKFHPRVFDHWNSLSDLHRRSFGVSSMLERVVNERLIHPKKDNDATLPEILSSWTERLEERLKQYDEATLARSSPLIRKQDIPKKAESDIFAALDADCNNEIIDPSMSLAALFVVGSDPIARHILATLYFLARDPGRVEHLREELDHACLSVTPTLQELIDRRDAWPKLRSVLAESYRLRDSEFCMFTERLVNSPLLDKEHSEIPQEVSLYVRFRTQHSPLINGSRAFSPGASRPHTVTQASSARMLTTLSLKDGLNTLRLVSWMV